MFGVSLTEISTLLPDSPEGNFDELVWNCQLEIQCVSNCDDTTKEEHHSFVAEVFSQFAIGRYTLPDSVTAAAGAAGVDFFCQDILAGSQIKTISERRWISSLILKVSCCAQGTESGPPPTPSGGSAVMGEGGQDEAWLGEGGEAVLQE